MRRASVLTTPTRRSKIILIGINGFKRSGKGTVAQMIDDRLTGNIVQVAFADKLKVMAARALGHDDLTTGKCVALMDEYKERAIIHTLMNHAPLRDDWMRQTLLAPCVSTISGRQYLQNFGNGARKVFGDTFWIDMVLPNPATHEGWGRPDELVIDAYPDTDAVIVTDVRYQNEAKRIEDLGGEVIEVVRPGLKSDGHISETPLPRHLVQHTIVNDGSLDDLRKLVAAAMDVLDIEV